MPELSQNDSATKRPRRRYIVSSLRLASRSQTERAIMSESETKSKYVPRPNLGGYNVKPDDDMSGHGWKKEITVTYTKFKENGEIECEERDFYTKDFQCSCGSNEYLWLVSQKEGVGLACTYCKTVESTVHRDYGVFRKRYVVTPDQAYEIMKAKGYRDNDIPMRPLMKRLKKKSKLYTSRKRPKS